MQEAALCAQREWMGEREVGVEGVHEQEEREVEHSVSVWMMAAVIVSDVSSSAVSPCVRVPLCVPPRCASSRAHPDGGALCRRGCPLAGGVCPPCRCCPG